MQITSLDLKKYIQASRSCHCSSKGLLLKNNSYVNFYFEEECELFLLRGPGSDGKILINDKLFFLPPNKPKPFSVDNNVIISTTPNTRGCFYVVGANLKEKNIEEPLIVINSDWISFLKKIGKTSGLKYTDVGFLASEFAEISDAKNIKDIRTDPPAAFKRNENKITFLHPCRIFEIILNENLPEINNEKEKVDDSSTFNITPQKEQEVESKYLKIDNKMKMIYKSGSLKLKSLFNHSNVYQSGYSVKMNSLGTFSLPMSVLLPNAKYDFVIKANKSNGNGKFLVQLITTDGSVRDSKIIISSLSKNEYKVTFNTGKAPDVGNKYCLRFSRPQKISTGNVHIESVNAFSLLSNEKQELKINNINENSEEQIKTENIYVHINGLDTPKKEKIIYNNWNLKIPKIAHFYWGGKLSFLRYVSICSFIKNNPDWHVKLHIPSTTGNIIPKWKTGEQRGSVSIQKNNKDYFNLVEKLNLEIVKHDFSQYNFSNDEHEVHKSDFLRWILLSTDGGVWSDFDIIYTHPMHLMVDNDIKNSEIDTGTCRYNAGSWANGSHAIGFLMSCPDNLYYRNVSQMSKRFFNKGRYQTIGADLLNKKFNSLKRASVGCKFLDIHPDNVYSITDINKFIKSDTYIQDYPNSIGFHWYGGHPDISKIENEINEKNYKDNNTFIGKLVKHTMDS